MATYSSNLIPKRIRHRGVYEGREQSLSGTYRLKVGTALTTADVLNMVVLGENSRPDRIIVSYKEVSGTPVITGGSVSVGVAPLNASTLTRADGTTYPPLTANATLYSAAADLGAGVLVHVSPTVAPSTNTDWGPFVITLTPTEATSVAGGEIDIVVTVEFRGELTEADPVYSEFNSGKYKN
jgi:hypothetical protein